MLPAFADVLRLNLPARSVQRASRLALYQLRHNRFHHQAVENAAMVFLLLFFSRPCGIAMPLPRPVLPSLSRAHKQSNTSVCDVALSEPAMVFSQVCPKHLFCYDSPYRGATHSGDKISEIFMLLHFLINH